MSAVSSSRYGNFFARFTSVSAWPRLAEDAPERAHLLLDLEWFFQLGSELHAELSHCQEITWIECSGQKKALDKGLHGKIDGDKSGRHPLRVSPRWTRCALSLGLAS